MQLGEYVDRLRRELAVAAEAGGDETRAVAERLIAALESATRLTLLEALSTAADEITRELAPGSVHLRLRGREPDFVVAPAPAPQPATMSTAMSTTGAEPAPAADLQDGGPVSRINFRPPEHLKARIEEAAAREGLSVNVWLVRAASAALEPERTSPRPEPGGQGRLTGWVG
jgi:hypothetical protein